jgi:hypothetical protein
VGLGGLLGDDQGVADLGVRQAMRDEPQHLGLPAGQRAEPGEGRGTGAGPPREVGDQPAGYRRGQQRVTRGDHPDGMHEFSGGRVLEQEAAGPLTRGARAATASTARLTTAMVSSQADM